MPRCVRLFASAAAAAALALFRGDAPAGRLAVLPEMAGAEAQLPILFEAEIPLNELPISGWTDAQRKDILYFLERMKKDGRIFLLVEVAADPIGRRDENRRWAEDVAREVGRRLVEAGFWPDRLLLLPAKVDTRLFDEFRWDGFRRRQVVRIRALQGGAWLARREEAALVREELPPKGTTRILEPAEGTTDRAHHILKGTTDPSVRSVAVVIGGKSRTAAVYNGAFETPISLLRGENLIVVTGLDRYGRALRAARTVSYVPPHPSIEILSPPRGAFAEVTRNPVTTVSGRIRSANRIRAAYLIQNDLPQPMAVRPDGTFEQRAVLVTEEDTFTVEAVDEAGETGISEERRVRAEGVAERPLLAILQWDEDGVDLDLHVTDEAGRRSNFEAPDLLRSAGAIPDGRIWIDNRDGFGPEVFTIEGPTAGHFTFSVDYYRGKKECRAYLTVVLFAGSPSRRLVRTFGPISLSQGSRQKPVVQVALPSGTVTELYK